MTKYYISVSGKWIWTFATFASIWFDPVFLFPMISWLVTKQLQLWYIDESTPHPPLINFSLQVHSQYFFWIKVRTLTLSFQYIFTTILFFFNHSLPDLLHEPHSLERDSCLKCSKMPYHDTTTTMLHRCDKTVMLECRVFLFSSIMCLIQNKKIFFGLICPHVPTAFWLFQQQMASNELFEEQWLYLTSLPCTSSFYWSPDGGCMNINISQHERAL